MLDDKDIDHLKGIFVTREECDMTTRDIHAQMAHNNTELAVIKYKVSQVLYVMSAVGLAVLTLVVDQFWG